MKQNSIALALFICACWCLTGQSLAAEAISIQLEAGKLVGLPSEYSPAELDLKPLRLRIRDREVNLFIVRILCPEGHPFGIAISASATHDQTLAPRSITLHITPTGKDFGYDLVLNLDNLEVISLHVVVSFDEGTKRRFEVQVSGILREKHKASIKQFLGNK